ncbi:MAG: DUF262 domain-containing protein [Rhodocyclaceae bacterium]|nr:DUF262 domain-containing protein [Rhodocyclaceae bacterium]
MIDEETIAEAPQEEPVDDGTGPEAEVPQRYSITAYGADYPVDGLVKRLRSGDILIPTFDPELLVNDEVEGFQRQFIWTGPQCDRFIDSLLLGFPVPGIFLVKQADNRLLVLDGQQRLRTLQAFYQGTIRGREYKLENVQARYVGRTYESLDIEDRRRLDDTIIHATILRQDEPSDDQSSIYLIFERLNTGGTTLQPQEIRVALHRGAFVRLLRELNDLEQWRQLYGNKSNRLKDHELILRFFALLFWADKYARPMKDFLNRYMSANRELGINSADHLRRIFIETTSVVLAGLGTRAFRLKVAINAALLDSVMVGIARRLLAGRAFRNVEALRPAFDGLVANEQFMKCITRSTADEESVRIRLELATAAFGTLE